MPTYFNAFVHNRKFFSLGLFKAYKRALDYFFFLLAVLLFMQVCGCKKLVQIDPPTSTITTAETFSDSSDAASAIAGLYSKLINTNSALSFMNGSISIYTGSSSDELIPFYSTGDQFYNNTLTSDNSILYSFFWTNAYQEIYSCNAIIEGLQSSTTVNSEVKNRFIGEAKFIRSLIYFYLINLFGDAPYITTTDYKSNSLVPNTAKEQTYKAIVGDLKFSENNLPGDYSAGGGERVRANKWAASALLAKVYLFQQKWDSAESEAAFVLDNTLIFHLVSALDSVFLKNSNETILQWQLNTQFYPFNSTTEGYNLIPLDNTSPPLYYISNQLLNSFEIADQRRISWLDSTNYNDSVYYYPYKYKIGPSQGSPNLPATEYYSVLRLAEVYLIRSEARAEQNNLQGAIADLDVIRKRAGLSNTLAVTQEQILNAIFHERQIEMLCEWGNRWFDLIRTGRVGEVLGVIPYKTWQPYQNVYPIPISELSSDPNLKQNSGY